MEAPSLGLASTRVEEAHQLRDYAKFREIADANGSLLMMDMAHISGLVATQEQGDPFKYCDIVTTTTHKSLRGPRSGIIFFRKDARGFEDRINNAVFPALQGARPRRDSSTRVEGLCSPQAARTSTRSRASPCSSRRSRRPSSRSTRSRSRRTWRPWPRAASPRQRLVRSRAEHTQAARLVEKGYALATGGTDNHLILWDLRPAGVTGSKIEKICDVVQITLNKNAVPGDVSGGVSPRRASRKNRRSRRCRPAACAWARPR